MFRRSLVLSQKGLNVKKDYVTPSTCNIYRREVEQKGEYWATLEIRSLVLTSSKTDLKTGHQ